MRLDLSIWVFYFDSRINKIFDKFFVFMKTICPDLSCDNRRFKP
jgi:hypothetical protein